ncbi:hypothetical protein GF337_00095 [candidate division KSB1 bacterium]|nr:hypothetical protein [candidate division KSB1 bacterium]
MKINKKINRLSGCLLLACFLVLMTTSLYGQWTDFERLTRSRMWIDLHSFPGPEYTLPGDAFNYFDYPGTLYDANYQRKYQTGRHRMGFMVHASVDGVPTAFRCESVKSAGQPFDATGLTLLEPVSKTINYNLENGNGTAEEVVNAKLGLDYYGLEVHWKAMAWSFPKYDDFVILEFNIINPADNTKTITDLRWAYTVEWALFNTSAPGIGEFYHFPRARMLDDDLFEWDPDRELFYWHDGHQVVNQEIDNPFTWSYGNTKSDVGEPIDLYDQDAVEHDFRAPQYVTCALLDKSKAATGDEPDHYNFVFPAPYGAEGPEFDLNNRAISLENYGRDYFESSMKHYEPLPKNEEGTYDAAGNFTPGAPITPPAWYPNQQTVERTGEDLFFNMLLNSGPWDIAPGETITLTYAVAGGHMEWDRVIAGGLENQAHLIDGREKMWEHLDAARELFDNNYYVNEVPPPTPTDGWNSLTFETRGPAGSNPGIMIKWSPVTLTGLESGTFAGYNVYHSYDSPHGPWEKVATVSANETPGDDGMISYYDERQLGSPNWYCVTTYDTDGRESGKVNPNIQPLYPDYPPSNDLDEIVVVPNPFKLHSRIAADQFKLDFVGVPAKCTIRIYTLNGDLVMKLNHGDGSGAQEWVTTYHEGYGLEVKPYQMTNQNMQRIVPGIYIFHVESHVEGHEGETHIGKFVIIR